MSKYKRSEWFEGLLETEDLIKRGYIPHYEKLNHDKVWSDYFWFHRPNEAGIVGIHLRGKPSKLSGVCDYLDHINFPYKNENRENYWYY